MYNFEYIKALSVMKGRPGMVFCNINDKLVNIIKKIASNRIVIDVGCGIAGLEKFFNKDKIISIDAFPPCGAPNDVITIEAEYFNYDKNHFPVIIRPCHSGFVNESILKMKKDGVESLLYISKKQNVNIDLNTESDEYNICELPFWTGEDDEKLYLINFTTDKNIKNLNKKRTWLKIKNNNIIYWVINCGKFWMQSNGSYFIKKNNYDILDIFYGYSYDLNYSFLFPKSEYIENDDGWLDRDGIFYKCGYSEHKYAAEVIFNKTELECEKAGIVKITTKPLINNDDKLKKTYYFFPDKNLALKLSSLQKRWLFNNGFKINEFDI